MPESFDSINDLSTTGGDTPQRKLGKYLLLRPLGRGGMGEVWLARDTLADIEVALKMLPPELRHSEEAQDQIRTSYQRVHRLGHPHICAVKDLVTDRGTGFFLVMDFFEGITLSQYRSEHVAKHGRMTVAEVVRLLTPVAQALDYAHSVGLAHRDIKPGNILVSPDGQKVRVIDFQLASDIRASVSRLPNAPVNTSGTYPYMAPEQFLGQRASAQTDLYALAMVAYELLDGQLPYEAHSWDQWKSIVTDERSVLPTIDDIPPEAQLALEAGLSREKSRRTGTCSQWVQSLTAAPADSRLSLRERASSQEKDSSSGKVTSHEPERSFAERKATVAQLGDTKDITLPAGVPHKLIWCPPGTFLMGTPGERAVDVTLTNGFWLGQTVVTQAMWTAVMETTPWVEHGDKSFYKVGANYPAVYINHIDATAFCDELSKIERKAGRLLSGWKYALPTEAQWEYACRAGTPTTYSYGDDEGRLGQHAWFDKNAWDIGEKYAHAVGAKKPNPWGLFDMHGNVWEWCADWYGDKLAGGTNPGGPSTGSSRVDRGGGWGDSSGFCRSAYRCGDDPSCRDYCLGFRLCLSSD